MPQVSKYVWTLNKAQQQALKGVYDRAPIFENIGAGISVGPINYRAFRKKVVISHTMNCAMVPWAGMWLGIEQDGHTHS